MQMSRIASLEMLTTITHTYTHVYFIVYTRISRRVLYFCVLAVCFKNVSRCSFSRLLCFPEPHKTEYHSSRTYTRIITIRHDATIIL